MTGLGVVAPNGVGTATFWQSLVAGKSAVDYISAFDPTPYPSKVAAEVRDFHPLDFMRRHPAKTAGRSSQFAVASTRLALADAQLTITPNLSPSVAICYGTSGGADVFELAARSLLSQGLTSVSPWAALEYPPHAPASYIAIEMGITGPAISVSSNCCTGIDAIRAAASLVGLGQSRVAIAGSSEAPISPVAFATFCALGSLSTRACLPVQASRPYDRLRDGLVISEGAAALILESRDSALARGVPVYAEILGSAGASEAIGMRKGDIDGRAMARAITQAISRSSAHPWDIDHINAHGSSLQDFDIADSNAFKLALGDHVYKIPITSIKSMIGQPFSAAGSLQASAACLTIAKQIVPPTINQEVKDPACDLDYVPNRARVARVRTVLINGHSFGGSVAALIIGAAAQDRLD